MNGRPGRQGFAAADLAGLAVIVAVALAVWAVVGFDSLTGAVVLLLALGTLVLAEHKLDLPARRT